MDFQTSIVLGISTTPPKEYAYRTELYLQQRQQQQLPSPANNTTTTWKALVQQKQTNSDDQAEIDRVLATLDSIHGTLNRSVVMPYSRVYSTLYGDEEDASTRLMRTFCQRQDHFRHDYQSSKATPATSLFDSMERSLDTNHDDETDEDNEKTEKRNSYDSGFGSLMTKRHLPRDPFSLSRISVNEHLYELRRADMIFWSNTRGILLFEFYWWAMMAKHQFIYISR